jgi:hypothetical protein
MHGMENFKIREDKKLLHLPEIEPLFLGRLAHSLVTIPTEQKVIYCTNLKRYDRGQRTVDLQPFEHRAETCAVELWPHYTMGIRKNPGDSSSL